MSKETKPYETGNCMTGAHEGWYVCKHILTCSCGEFEAEPDGCKVDGSWEDDENEDCPEFECKTYDEIIAEMMKFLGEKIDKIQALKNDLQMKDIELKNLSGTSRS